MIGKFFHKHLSNKQVQRVGRTLGRNWNKSLKSCPPCHSQSPLLTDFYYPPPFPHTLSKSGMKLVCNVNIVYGISSLRTRICPETSSKLYVHEFGFCSSVAQCRANKSYERVDWSFFLLRLTFSAWLVEPLPKISFKRFLQTTKTKCSFLSFSR